MGPGPDEAQNVFMWDTFSVGPVLTLNIHYPADLRCSSALKGMKE